MIEPPVVFKFGGTSVGDPRRYRTVLEQIKGTAQKERVVVIVSAMSGVTDHLVAAVTQKKINYEPVDTVAKLFDRYNIHAATFLNGEPLSRYNSFLCRHLQQLESRLNFYGVSPLPAEQADEVLALGERLSTRLLADVLSSQGVLAHPVDAVNLVSTDDTFGQAQVFEAITLERIGAWYQELEKEVVPVVTGFIGGAENGRTTTLGRGGSDYSAALFAAGVCAQRLERWTDVDGIYDKDPNLYDDAVRYDELELESILDLNHEGLLGMHRKALDPLVQRQIPIKVHGIDDPGGPGTLITSKRARPAFCEAG